MPWPSPATTRCVRPRWRASRWRRSRGATGGQPAARQRVGRRSAEQAGGGAGAVPGDRLRQRYLAHDALNGLAQATARIDDAGGARRTPRPFRGLPGHVQDNDLALGIAMTDARGERSRRPHQQANADALRARRRTQRAGHRHQRHQGDRHRWPLHARVARDAQPEHGARTPSSRCAARCRVDAPGITIVSRPPGRPGENWSMATRRSRAATGSHRGGLFDRVVRALGARVRAGDWEHSHVLTYSYATRTTATAASPRARASATC